MKKAKDYVPVRLRLAQNLVRVRTAAGISQEELADRAGLHRTYIGHLEQAARNPSLENIEKVAIALDVDVSDLITRL